MQAGRKRDREIDRDFWLVGDLAPLDESRPVGVVSQADLTG